MHPFHEETQRLQNLEIRGNSSRALEPRLCDEIFGRLLERVVSIKWSLILRSSFIIDLHQFLPWLKQPVLVLPLHPPRRNGLQLIEAPAAARCLFFQAFPGVWICLVSVK